MIELPTFVSLSVVIFPIDSSQDSPFIVSRQATSYVVEVSRLRYWVLNFNISEAGLAGPNKGQYVLVNGEAPYWLINFIAF